MSEKIIIKQIRDPRYGHERYKVFPLEEAHLKKLVSKLIKSRDRFDVEPVSGAGWILYCEKYSVSQASLEKIVGEGRISYE